ncbi:hypothetical protein EON80_24305 [bacterium]|nr:MAG: hypothetical protein EON80_24305 [bacterium]
MIKTLLLHWLYWTAGILVFAFLATFVSGGHPIGAQIGAVVLAIVTFTTLRRAIPGEAGRLN